MMDGGLVMEQDLTQAVKIVIKYEIQSLLSRLSEIGEEYIVLTASSGEGTCGHIGSVKGEGFIQSSSINSVKQEFLNFCSGKQKSTASPAVTNTTSTPKPNRRKSTPRCKFQQSAVVIPFDETGVSEISQSVPETDHTSSLLADSALDLSERTSGYSYTLGSKNEPSNFNGNAAQNAFPGFPYEELENQQVKLPRFTWQDEKLKCVGQEIGDVSDESFPIKLENEAVDKIENGGSNDLSYGDVNAYQSIFERVRQQRKNKRKNRKAPMKIQKREVNIDLPLDSTGSVAVKMENETPAGGFDSQVLSALNVAKINDIESPEIVNNNSVLKSGVSGFVSKTAKKNSITDMKSAFEEIGNMAKCLICNKILANKNNRTFHWRSHVGDKRYTCDICNKAFTHPSNMRSHRKIHTDEKPFPCDLCERRFRRRDYLLQHLERFHYNPKKQPEKPFVEGESNSN